MRKFYKKHADGLLGFLGVLLFFLFWQWAGQSRAVNPFFISYPTAIWQAAWELFSTGFIYSHLLVSGKELFVGYAAAVVVGIALGVTVGWYKVAYGILNPFITALYITPRVALLPLLILWLGIGFTSKATLVFLGAVFPILINVFVGMKSIDSAFIRVARSFQASDLQLFRTVALPFCLPYILAGLRLAIGRGLLGIVVGELYGSAGGIGYLLNLYGATFQIDKLMVMIFVLIIVGVLLTEAVYYFEKRLSYNKAGNAIDQE